MTDENKSAESNPPEHRRSVRSFVLRMGRATAAQQRALTELWPVYGIDFGSSEIDLNASFGRTAPRLIEIGFGNGEALIEFAKSHPEIDCIGIEVHRPGVGHLLLDAQALELKNVRVISHDAVEVLEKLAPESISFVHIFFPDPWPKKRHHKRRLIQPAFVRLLASRLAAGATLHCATDWEPYAEQMLAVLAAEPSLVNAAPGGFADRPSTRPLTKFE